MSLRGLLRERYEAYCAGRRPSAAGKLLLWSWLWLSALFLQNRIAGLPSWQLPRYLFPQVDLLQPRWSDPLRALVQVGWLLFVRRQAVPGYIDLWGAISRLRRWLRLHMRRLSLRAIAAYRAQFSEELVRRGLDVPPWQKPGSGRSKGLKALLIVCLALLCITVPLELAGQFALGASLFVVLLICNRLPGRFPRMLMIVLSLLASCRYIWWRCTNTLNFDDPLGLALGILLLLAELYAWVVLVLGYFQNIWPLNRPLAALPEDRQKWPTVDILVPTYNEELDVVRATIYACLGLDWPAEKLNIYILDDGRRESFRAFASDVGVKYITRTDNRHAKAGNINHALKQIDGEFVAIFDCDHIPTRAFLQVAMGGFLQDSKLALVQTPHHFFSPDPFERNLSNFRKVPNEGGLFYGLIQNGNDLWNGTFFCGSCAIIRRAPLDEIGGIAVETVTEDAHTSLRLHRRGYRSSYVRAPVAAGLATETLSAHIGQRIRWARGMSQILRIDNPLKGKGLQWPQRLCYFNAMLHFLSGIPRLIFLVAPLAFLLLHTYIIYAPAAMLFLYVLPHMVYASVVNARIQGRYRHSFWGEVYETVLSWYIARPTAVALFAPNKGSFNVTAKGGLIYERYFDWVMSRPYILLVVANVIGLAVGIGWLLRGAGEETGAVLLNLSWTFYNLLILGGAVAVAAEAKQQRRDHRVELSLPISLRLEDGHVLQARLRDFSLSGLRVQLSPRACEGIGHHATVVLDRAGREYSFPVSVVYKGRETLGLQLRDRSPASMINYVQCTFARADNWVRWKRGMRTDRPLESMRAVMDVSLMGYRRLLRAAPQPIPRMLDALLSMIHWVVSLRPQPVSIRTDG